jgi:hypothetical protein
MVATTSAAVRGAGEKKSGLFAWHTLGLLVGTLILAALTLVAQAAAHPARDALLLSVGVTATTWGTATVLGRPLPVPSSKTQVPRAWSYTMSYRQALFAYGVGLGFGIATRVQSVNLYVLIGVLIAAGSPALAVGSLSSYAMLRAAPLLVTPHDPLRWGRHARRAMTADGVLLIASGVVAVASLAVGVG